MRLLFVSIVVVISIVSCSKDPTSTGLKQISNADIITTVIFDSDPKNINQRTSNYNFVLVTGLSSQIIIGKNNYAESDALIRFSMVVTDTLLNHLQLNNLIIQSAWVTMDSSYTLGSSTGNFDFSAYSITDYHSGNYWSLGFDRDSLSLLTYDNTNQNVNTSAAVVDSAVMQFNINPNLVMSWLKADNKINNTTNKNLGIILKPKSSTNKFFGFDATTTPPTIHVACLLPSGVLDTAIVSSNNCVHVVTPAANVTTKSDELYLEGGVSLRGTLYFDLSSLPKLSIFNKATLTLTIDTLNTFDGTPSSADIKAQILADTAAKKLADSTSATSMVRSGNQYSGDITWMLQKWNDGKVANQGMLISLSDELTSVARIAIYNSTAQNKDLRPRLKLYFIQKK